MSPQKKKEFFSTLFDTSYGRLYNYAFKVLGDRETSEEMVQETFIKLWENVDGLNTDSRSIESYLIVTLKNRIVDFYRKEKVRKKHFDLYQWNRTTLDVIDHNWDVMAQIDQVYRALPEKTVEIFKLSRNQGLSYKEIAEQKGISIKTVELHMSKALAAFKQGLKNFL